jgi:hypothetical protein
LNVNRVNDVRQTGIHTAEPLVPEPSASELEMAIEELSRRESRGNDKIPIKIIKEVCRSIRSQIHKIINSI